jgi:adenine phosphoribosyltransferase
MTMEQNIEDLRSSIRDIPDFPKKGIIFKDIATLLGKGELLKKAVDMVVEHFKNKGITKVLAVESRGFIFGAPVAYMLGAGFVPIRKKGKLPYKTIKATYQLEYGQDTLEMHEDAIKPGEKVLVVDDLLATGGTVKAVTDLAKQLNAEVVGLSFIIELTFLEGRKKLDGFDVFSIVKF